MAIFEFDMFKATRTAVRGELNLVGRGENLVFINIGIFCVCMFSSFSWQC